ncbi:MAG TPA: M55 family metallopeptidase [Fimbriimonadaceae bacterium]|nr:M55 family metallopeptidase [Fimbriimonadaceae bacterium]
MKVYISADIEGITGLVSWHQCGAQSGEHYDAAFARRMMTHDVNAAIRGARSAGAKEIVVKDSHGNSKTLLTDELEPGTQLISGHGSGIDGMMEGIDASFDCAMLIGYHAMAGTTAGIMEHTYTGGVHRLWINGRLSGEMGMSAGVAGRYGVPIVTVSSDAAGCAEAQDLVPGVQTATVKYGLGRYMGRLLHPSETGPLIEGAAARGVSLLGTTMPWKVAEPCTYKIEFNRSEEADFAAKHPGAKRLDAYTVEMVGETYEKAHQLATNVIAFSLSGIRSQN